MITVNRTFKVAKSLRPPGKYRGSVSQYHLTLPPEIGDLLPIDTMRFYVELTPEGILYRPSKPQVDVPDWVDNSVES